MSRARWLAVIVGILLALGLVAWLIDAVYRLYAGVSLASPLLGNLLLALLLVLLALLIAGVVYYGFLFGRPKRQRPRPRVPVQRSAAAKDSLEAVRQQATRIQDEVARQALLERSRELESTFARREFRLVVFGTGSAGKTSIVNAVLGRMVGQVGAPMGTTIIGETYPFRFKGLDREIHITDTPGILEAGIVGTEREQLARQLAAEADLLLFVIDNDLRQSEWTTLRSLVQIGKRSIVVFNKIDLYPEADLQILLDRLQDRLHPLIPSEDLVAVAANPQAITLESGETLRPDPEIIPLLRRMVMILRSEGEDLIADNLLFQAQQLGEAARELIDAERLKQAEKVVERFQWIGAGVVSAMPIPVVDILAAAAVNAQMVVEIGRVYDCEMNIERGKELAVSLTKTLISLGLVRGATEIFAIAMQTNVATFVIGRAVHGATAAYLTRIAGKSFIEYFRQDQNWGDGGITEVVQEQFRLNQRDEFMKVFVKQAIDRVVQPLQEREEGDRSS
ncbi:YcjF family protein [Egbenema bharatensis]|uniref:YcjF family protein n=1 Tax=Egbenema bharatensis TaxID=3463334 RepID=UPI003A889BA4